MAAMPGDFSLLVKPAGADCNLRCDYCFYLEKMTLYRETKRPRMSLETAEQILREYFATPQSVYSFGWQGGEPTLMGPDFFREVFAMQKRLAPEGSTIANGLQTNGTLLTSEWGPLLREYNVLVGLSIDGPKEIHDRYRVFAGDHRRGSYARVGETARLLREEKVAFNALTVVGRHNEDRSLEIYEHLRSLRIRHHQYIPLVEWNPDSETSGVRDFSVTPEGWGSFMKGIFDRWYPRDVRRVSIRHFDSVLELLVHGRYNACTLSGACGSHLVVEHNGDLYPCDFYVEPGLRLGNVHDEGEGSVFERVRRSTVHSDFVRRKADWPDECSRCEYLWLCGGDCPKFRTTTGELVEALDTPRGRSYLCSGWREFYDHTLERFLAISRAVSPELSGEPPRMPEMMEQWPAESDCFCGSGRPAGRCHRSAGPSA